MIISLDFRFCNTLIQIIFLYISNESFKVLPINQAIPKEL